MEFACFNFHVGLLFINCSSFKQDTENNVNFDVVSDEYVKRSRLHSVSAGRRSSSHRYVGVEPCWHLYAKCDLIRDALRGVQPVNSAKQRADVAEPRRREYLPDGCIQY